MKAALWGAGWPPRRCFLFALAAGGAALLIVALWMLGPEKLISTTAGPNQLEQVRALLRKGQTARAQGLADHWLGREPDSAFAWIARGWVALRTGRDDLAREAIDQARDRQTELSAHDLKRLAAARTAEFDDPTQAQALLIDLLDHSRQHEPEACRALALIALRTYQLKLAQLALERWTRDDPADPTPFVWMTEIDGRTEAGPEVAVEHLRQALARDPTHVEARRQLAEALRGSEQFAEALALYDEVLKTNEADPASQLGRAQTLIAMGRLDAAAADLDRVLQADPRHASALRERAAIDLARDDPTTALARLDAALALDAFDADACYRRATALDRLGRGSDARAERERAAQLRADHQALDKIQKEFNKKPNDPALRCQIAKWMFDHGQAQQGLRWIQTVLAGDVAHPEANRILAEYYESTGETARANYHRLFAQKPPARRAS